MSVLQFHRRAAPPPATANDLPLTRFTLFVLVEAALEQKGRRGVEVTITPRCDCGCGAFGVKLMTRDRSGVQYAVDGMSLQRAAVEIAEMVAALPGARDVN